MARKKKSWFKKNFGKHFDIWDAVLLITIIIVGYNIYITQGLEGFFMRVANMIFNGVIFAFIVKKIVDKAKK